MQYQMINDLVEDVPESALEFKASYFKANKQVPVHVERKKSKYRLLKTTTTMFNVQTMPSSLWDLWDEVK